MKTLYDAAAMIKGLVAEHKEALSNFKAYFDRRKKIALSNTRNYDRESLQPGLLESATCTRHTSHFVAAIMRIRLAERQQPRQDAQGFCGSFLFGHC